MNEESTTIDPILMDYQCDKEAVPCGCGLNNVRFSEGRIIDGEKSISNSWSMVVSVRSSDASTHLCGGSILNDSLILTAASCISNLPSYGLTVMTGSHRLSDNSSFLRKVNGIFIHPDYMGESTQYLNDIAILHLSEPLNLTHPLLSRTCISERLPFLSNNTQYPASDAHLVLVGWGHINHENRSIPDDLRQAEVYAADLSEENCPIRGSNHELQFCAGVIQAEKSKKTILEIVENIS